MICLQCGHRQPHAERENCASCHAEFRKVEGVFGVNNFTQVLQALEDFRASRIDHDRFREIFDAFYELWEKAASRWKVVDGRIRDMLALSPELQAVYEAPLMDIESGLDELLAAAEIADALEEAEESDLEALEDHLRLFFRKVCSSAGAIFTKLESRGGDFGALLSAFGV